MTGFFAAAAAGGGGGGGGAWTTVNAEALLGVSPGWSGYTIRVILDQSPMVAGTKLRLTINSSGQSIAMAKCFVQTKASSGDPYDFSAPPIQVMFGGNPTISSPGGTFVSDEIELAQDGSAGLVVSAYFGGDTALRYVGGTPDRAYAYVPGDDAATVNAGGYTLNLGASYMISEIEVWTP